MNPDWLVGFALDPSSPLAVGTTNVALDAPASVLAVGSVNFTVTSTPGLELMLIVAALATAPQHPRIRQARRFAHFMREALAPRRPRSNGKSGDESLRSLTPHHRAVTGRLGLMLPADRLNAIGNAGEKLPHSARPRDGSRDGGKDPDRIARRLVF
jgi:hypothetical protein